MEEQAIPEPREWPVLQIAPDMILEDPARFQSRAEYPRDARESDLRDVEGFDHDFADLIAVWVDPEDRRLYVIDGHRRLRLAKRVRAGYVNVRVLKKQSEADAFAMGVLLNVSQWAFRGGDQLLWACASRRAAFERALHTGWLDVDGEPATRLYEYYPDLGRRYSSLAGKGA